MITLMVGSVETADHLGPVTLGQMPFDIALLMDLTALDNGIASPDSRDGCPQGFRTIQHEQHRILSGQAPLTQFLQQTRTDLQVFRASLTQAQDPLATVQVNA